MRSSHLFTLTTVLGWAILLSAQSFRKPKIAGMTLASQYAAWSLPAQGPILALPTSQTVTLLSRSVTLPDGAQFQPLQTGSPVWISDGAASEAVTPLTVNCPVGGSHCVFTAIFAFAHLARFVITSATAGIQEAINAAPAGGWVLVDSGLVNIHAPIVIAKSLHLSGEGEARTIITQLTPHADGLDFGTPSFAPSDLDISNLQLVGPAQPPSASSQSVGLHCLNCVRLKLQNVTASNWGDGLFFDSAYGHAYTNDVFGCHFISNYVGVRIFGGSANRLTFVGNTIDSNAYGVFDDGGWVHTWLGNDIESNAIWGYYQQVSQPAAYSAHNIGLYNNYFENNGSNLTGQGDLSLGALVSGGSGNNGDGCIGCAVDNNLFNASTGGHVVAIALGEFKGSLSDNIYSGYGPGLDVTSISGPSPNYTHALALGDGSTGFGNIQRLDLNGSLTLGGSDQINNPQGSPILDTTLESPTGQVDIRGLPGGPRASNPATLILDGASTAIRSDAIRFFNNGVSEFTIHNDPYGANAHDMCLLDDDGNPSQSACLLYENGKHWEFSPNGLSGSHVPAGDYEFHQVANGDSALMIYRATDANPTGYLLDLEDSTESHPLFRIDATGDVVAGSWNAGPINSTALMQNGVAVLTPANLPLTGKTGGILGQAFTIGQCATSALTITGAAAGMVAVASPETDPGSGFVWEAFVSAANTVLIRLCNVSGSAQSSAASVYDVRVLQ